MRTFIAIELPEHVRAPLRELNRRLRQAAARASWVRPENIHLTLRFLDEIDQAQAARIGALLEEGCRGKAPFRLAARATGAFPNTRKPSVIWVGIEPIEGPLAEIQALAESAARAIGLPPDDKAFRAHLTLARIKDARTAGPVIELLQGEQEFSGGEFEVKSVSLFSSTLTPKGPIYERLREFAF